MVKDVLYKKPIILFIGFLFFIQLGRGQNPGHAREQLQQKDLARAKESIDSFVQAYIQNAAGWLLKAGIYNAISKDADAKNLVPDSRADAFAALQKAMQLDAVYCNNQLKQNSYALPFDLYNGYNTEGINYFNAAAERNDKASYAQALNKFKKAGEVSKYIFSNGWGLAATDSINLYHCAKAAINAGKEADAFLFAKKIADARITGKGYEPIYQWLAFYYKQQKDGDNLVKYTQQGMQYFPASVYFNLILIDWQRQQNNYEALFTGYETLFAKQPGNSKYQLAYYNDVFNYLYQSKLVIDNRAGYESKLSKGLAQLIKTDPANAAARLLLAKLYINQANDVAKEAAMRSTIDAKVMAGYKTAQKNLLLKADGQLKEILSKPVAAGKTIYEEVKGLKVLNEVMLK